MRMARVHLVAGAAIVALLVLSGLSIAANRIEVRVIEGGNAVAGASVDVITSSGVLSGTTDANGMFVTDIDGTAFRVRVNSVAEGRTRSVNESPVTITLN